MPNAADDLARGLVNDIRVQSRCKSRHPDLSWTASQNGPQNPVWFLDNSVGRIMSATASRRDQLCSLCNKIDFSLTNNRKADGVKYRLQHAETLRTQAAEGTIACPFCRLVYSVIQPYSDEMSTQWDPKGGFGTSMQAQSYAFLNESAALSPFGSAREVKAQIDPALIKKWIALCEGHHSDKCTPRDGVIQTAKSPSGIKVLRLIDAEDLCVVEAKPGMGYAALSYVWGQVLQIRLLRENLRTFSTKNGLPRHALTRTINDAIDLVHVIGVRYLWVDCLCLLQDDPDDMADGISKMDLVYLGATITIIAAHGNDANAGLPGVRPDSRRVEQTIAEVEDGIRMTVTQGIYNALGQSQHSQRAWTLQELVLSHRTLIFTSSCVYFRCRRNCWSEDTIFDNFPLVINENVASATEVEFFEDSIPDPLARSQSLLLRYCGRLLTKESDAINAFSGILRHSSIQMKSGLVEGIPTASFDMSLLFWDPFSYVSEFGRRRGFPSWSWAGWYGNKISYAAFFSKSAPANEWLETMTYIVWYKRDPGTLKLGLLWDQQSALIHGELEEKDIGYRPTPENPYGRSVDSGFKTPPRDDDDMKADIRRELDNCNHHLLHFWAQLVSFSALRHSETDSHPKFSTNDGSADVAGDMICDILSADGTVCGGVKFDDPDLEENFAAPPEFILLSKISRYENYFSNGVTVDRWMYWVMLIEWTSPKRVVAERRAIGFIFLDRLDQMLPPGRVWTEIVLA